MEWKHSVNEAQFVAWLALFLGLLLSGCSQRPHVALPGTFTFYETEVTGYSSVKESTGGYEFSITTNVASIDAIRKMIEAKADPLWKTDGWSAGEESPHDDVDIISYKKGPSKLTISIQAYKEEGDRKWYSIRYTYEPTKAGAGQEQLQDAEASNNAIGRSVQATSA